MAEPSAKSFLRLLEKSGLVSKKKLKPELARLAELAAGKTLGTPELAQHLIESGLITNWHFDKLKAGKYKGFFLGKFRILGHLGSGGMSSVYLAEHKISGQLRAIKVLPRKKVADKSYLERFYLEARAAASLNHPNVVRIYDICEEENTHYMVMEYVEGKNFHQMVTDNGGLPFDVAAKFIAQACKGLQHAHDRELVHRDIKPANLLSTSEGHVKILDLGLALMEQDDEESLTLLYNDKVMGTADYLSPEQAVNSHEVDHRADIYSLGCTFYYLLAGKTPFPQGTLAQRIAMHQSREPEDIRHSRQGCPQPLVDLVNKMMRKQPEDRYQDCGTIESDLTRLIETDGLQPDPNSLPTSPKDDNSVAMIEPSEQPQPDVNPIESIQISASGKTSPNPTDSKSKPNPKTKSKSEGNLGVTRKKSSKKKKRKGRPPSWLLPAIIILMVVILAVVLYVCLQVIAIRSTNPDAQTFYKGIACVTESTNGRSRF
ncbi:MAG: serine/threonine-protein kinase [Planctomycetota bacterium]